MASDFLMKRDSIRRPIHHVLSATSTIDYTTGGRACTSLQLRIIRVDMFLMLIIMIIRGHVPLAEGRVLKHEFVVGRHIEVSRRFQFEKISPR